MRQQDQQINDNGPDVVRSEPVPVTGPGQADPPPPASPSRTDYPEGTADQGPEDALDERGSYDSDLADGPGPWSGGPSSQSRDRDERIGHDRLPEERAQDDALDDDALADRTPADGTGSAHRTDEPGTGDRGDLADASQADAGDPHADADDPRPGPDTDDPDGDHPGPDRPEFHEPAPLPTSFGAPTVGGAVAASALAGSHRDAREDDTVRSADGPAEDRIDGIDDEPDRDFPTTRTENDHHATPDDDEDRSLGAADASVGRPSTAVDHDPVDGVGSDQTAVVGTSHPVNPDVLSAGNPDAAIGGVGDADDADPARDAGPDSEGTGVAADGELLPGAAPAEPIVAILSQDTVQSFRDRWRDVQLRFVDDPPGATADAHRLVEESVDALTAALTAQREELGSWQNDGATDTEQLRMVVRRHRDFLDRLLGS